MSKLIKVSEMKSGISGRVVKVAGGMGLQKKLENLGLRPGTRLKKVSQQIMRGPVMVRVGQTQIAMGCGMADKVFVEID
ncbi:MAG: ferrous iron transport protein A [Elusimicrobia bacterium]|nr:ferrous iron transport protein A [Elusimicrobiota bacterium]